MFVTRKHLSRRTLLKGLGTAVALPLLDSMTPAFAAPTAASAYPNRLFFTYIPIGAIMDEWIPTGTETDFQFKRILQPLTPFKDDLLILGNLDCQNGYALGDGGGDHARAGPLTSPASIPRKPREPIFTPVSRSIRSSRCRRARPRSSRRIELGCEDSRTVGACDSGYSCAYQNSVSWRTPTLAHAARDQSAHSLRAHVRNRRPERPADVRARQAAARKSILDFVSDDTKRSNPTSAPPTATRSTNTSTPCAKSRSASRTPNMSSGSSRHRSTSRWACRSCSRTT